MAENVWLPRSKSAHSQISFTSGPYIRAGMDLYRQYAASRLQAKGRQCYRSQNWVCWTSSAAPVTLDVVVGHSIVIFNFDPSKSSVATALPVLMELRHCPVSPPSSLDCRHTIMQHCTYSGIIILEKIEKGRQSLGIESRAPGLSRLCSY